MFLPGGARDDPEMTKAASGFTPGGLITRMTAREKSRLGASLLILEPAIDGANARRAGIPTARKRMARRT